ncbi:hypothetical protein EVAR_29801_1 [Eumeta japonica]|uniref:Uncharacterized protein n=1 Tax=Eumeta variegata TaxID=151549 RepID=A0A4C1XSH2_EUMVA|nr:hypothetical protein EVAR_29801_1 [Eumeta japonica]
MQKKCNNATNAFELTRYDRDRSVNKPLMRVEHINGSANTLRTDTLSHPLQLPVPDNVSLVSLHTLLSTSQAPRPPARPTRHSRDRPQHLPKEQGLTAVASTPVTEVSTPTSNALTASMSSPELNGASGVPGTAPKAVLPCVDQAAQADTAVVHAHGASGSSSETGDMVFSELEVFFDENNHSPAEENSNEENDVDEETMSDYTQIRSCPKSYPFIVFPVLVRPTAAEQSSMSEISTCAWSLSPEPCSEEEGRVYPYCHYRRHRPAPRPTPYASRPRPRTAPHTPSSSPHHAHSSGDI